MNSSLKRAATPMSSDAKRPRKNNRAKPTFNSMLQKLEEFTKVEKRLPKNASSNTSSSSAPSSSSSSSTSAQDIIKDPRTDEAALRLWLDRQLKQQVALNKVVSIWVNENGKHRTKWQLQCDKVIAFRQQHGRWPCKQSRQKWISKSDPVAPEAPKSNLELELAEHCTKIRHTGAGINDGTMKRRHGIKLTRDHINQLTALNFEWSFSDTRWQFQYDTLNQWLNEHEHKWPKTIWPKDGSKRTDEQQRQHALSQWVSSQRQIKNGTGMKAVKRGKTLTSEMVRKMDLLGMKWSKSNKTAKQAAKAKPVGSAVKVQVAAPSYKMSIPSPIHDANTNDMKMNHNSKKSSHV